MSESQNTVGLEAWKWGFKNVEIISIFSKKRGDWMLIFLMKDLFLLKASMSCWKESCLAHYKKVLGIHSQSIERQICNIIGCKSANLAMAFTSAFIKILSLNTSLYLCHYFLHTSQCPGEPLGHKYKHKHYQTYFHSNKFVWQRRVLDRRHKQTETVDTVEDKGFKRKICEWKLQMISKIDHFWC